jgi:uncharacterized protein (TIGR02001 family)
MNSWKKMLGVAIVAGAPMAASALEVSGNVAMATDYAFRGLSQTNERGAIQGGFDIGFESGAYIGTWSSNVAFTSPDDGDISSQELDLYVGYGFSVSENVSVDVSAIQFFYPGTEAEFNYNEYVVSVAISDFSVGLVYSPDYFGDGGGTGTVVNFDYSLGLSEVMSMDFHVGVTSTEDDGYLDEDDGYMDYLVGLNYDVAGVTVSLAYVGNDIDDETVLGEAMTDDRLILSVSKSL